MTDVGPLIIRGIGDKIQESGEARRGIAAVPGTTDDLILSAPATGNWRLFYLQHPQAGWAVTDDLIHTFGLYPELADSAISVLRPGGFFGIVPGSGPKEITLAGSLSDQYSEISAPSTLTLPQAAARVDAALAIEARNIAQRKRRVRLLLSGGVDSGLLASHLVQAGADLECVTIRSPWGDEIAGASRTASHVGAELKIVDVTADDIVSGLVRCMRLLQTDDAETVAIHVLVTLALTMGEPTDLVTGLGSDLLNASGEVGMGKTSDNLVERVGEISASGMMITTEHTEGARLFHPYWTSASILTQLSVPRSLKSKSGMDKYYLRELASRRLPPETAYGRKVAIHQGSGLVAGLESHLGEPLQQFCSRAWKQNVANLTNLLETSS